ncbi:MAG TPA: LamG domain-containing protein, partial [Sedimentisphaerales bacterium]|nr:LamG domain-containing protein [Sedimentisphaerales bacterium]
MCRKLVLLISSGTLLIMAANVSAGLVGHWKLDEGSGTTAADSSGNGNDGTIFNNPTWISGVNGTALEFHGLGVTGGGGDYINCGSGASLDITGPISIALWIRPDADDPEGKGTTTAPLAKAQSGMTPNWSYQVRYGWGQGAPTPYMSFTFNTSPRAWAHVGRKLDRNEWCHIACSYDGTTLKCYLNGAETSSTPMGAITSSPTPVLIGSDGWGSDWIGAIDDVRMYSHALLESEILGAMEGKTWPYAFGPQPEDGALHPTTWAELKWKASPVAVTHDVYIGDNFDGVNNGAAETFRRNQATTSLLVGFPGYPYPDGLVPGTTYYWRIDEVNNADPNSPWKGPVWSFSIPPRTAYNPNPTDGAEFVDLNAKLTWTAGFDAKFHTVYFGDNFDDVNSATAGTMAATPTYNPGPLKSAKVYYWRVDESDPPATHKGQVWSFTTPGAVGNPHPSNGAAGAEMNAILAWTPSD